MLASSSARTGRRPSSSMTARTTAGSITARPAATAWIAPRMSSGGASFRTNALAPARSGSQDVLIQAECREHDHAGAAVGVGESACRFDAIEDRHAHIHQHDVRLRGFGLLDGLAAVGSLADDGQGRVGVDDAPQTGSNERLVVCQEYPDRAHLRGHGEARNEEISTEVAPAGDERSAVERDPLANAEEPMSAAWEVGGRTDTVVSDLDLQCRSVPAQPHARSSRAAVAEGVRQRLLHDAIGRDVGAGAQRARHALDDERYVQTCSPHMVEQVFEAREARLRDECVSIAVGAQHSQQPTHFLEGAPPGSLDRR